MNHSSANAPQCGVSLIKAASLGSAALVGVSVAAQRRETWLSWFHVEIFLSILSFATLF